MRKVLHTVSLFTSFSTLFCCALPALMVAIGAGATLAGLVSNVPELIWISAHKPYLFAFSTCMLSFTGFMLWRAKHAPCPSDPTKASTCKHTRKASKYVYFTSLGFYTVGTFFAYVAPFLMKNNIL